MDLSHLSTPELEELDDILSRIRGSIDVELDARNVEDELPELFAGDYVMTPGGEAKIVELHDEFAEPSLVYYELVVEPGHIYATERENVGLL